MRRMRTTLSCACRGLHRRRIFRGSRCSRRGLGGDSRESRVPTVEASFSSSGVKFHLPVQGRERIAPFLRAQNKTQPQRARGFRIGSRLGTRSSGLFCAIVSLYGISPSEEKKLFRR